MPAMDTEVIEIYKEYRIEINSVPEQQFDFDDFGWAFQVFKDDELCFRMVIKTANSKKTDANKTRVLTWGKEKIHKLLDTEGFEKKTDYCYQWVDVANTPSPQKIDCDYFLQKDRRAVYQELQFLRTKEFRYQENLDLIETKKSEFIDSGSVPFDLQNADKIVSAELMEIRKRIDALENVNAFIAKTDSLTVSVKDDIESIRKDGAAPERIEMLERQIENLTESYKRTISELGATSSPPSNIEPRLTILQPSIKLVDANLAYKYAGFQEDANTLLGFTSLFLGVTVGELISLGVSITSKTESVVIAIHATAVVFGLLVMLIFGYLTWKAKQKSDEAKKQFETDIGVKEVVLRSINLS